MRKYLLLFVSAFGINFLLPVTVFAHCPLCTIGAGAVALGATWLGISTFTVGIFLGVFAVALGLWVGRLIKKKFIPYQTFVISLISFLTTILPLKPLFYDNTAVYITLYGEYGSLLNRTYVIDKYLIGSVIGAIILLVSPKISRSISRARNNKLFPFQGIILTFVLLLIISIVYELFIR